MKKTKDLTPRMSNLMTAEQEMMLPYRPGETPLGERIGGLQMFSDTFKRGHGDNVFGSDQNGIWLGSADYANAPFRVNMQGQAFLQSLVAGGDVLTKSEDGQVLSGQIIAGGSVDGAFIVKDALGDIVGVFDKDGLLIEDGKLVIKSDVGQTIIDSQGIVGNEVFTTAQAGKTNSSTVSTTSTSITDIPDTTNASFSIDRTRMLLAIFTAEFAFMDADGGLDAYIYIGGDINDVQEPRISLKGSVHRATGSSDFITLTAYVFRAITANTPPTSYTIKARWAVASGVTAFCRNRQLSYYLLGN